MMSNTLTVGEVIKVLQKYPDNTPIFHYDIDKEKDTNINVMTLQKPGEESFMSPFYCKSESKVEKYWKKYGVRPVLYLMEGV